MSQSARKYYHWNIKCAVDGIYYPLITDSLIVPTVCPNNAAHGVETYELLKVVPINGFALTNEDGRMVVSPGMFPDYLNPYYTSVSDNYTTGIMGAGERMIYSHANGSSATNMHVIQFTDYTQILGGFVITNNTNANDYLSFDAYAPGTPTTLNVAVTGNCNKIPTGLGFNIIIPAPGNGHYDVDLDEPMNANLVPPNNKAKVTKAVPVTAVGGYNLLTENGYWDWDFKTGEITPNYTGTGGYNLYDAEIHLVKYVNKMCVYAGTTMPYKFRFQLVHRGGPFLPHWRIEITTTRDASHTVLDPAVYYGVTLIMARRTS